MTETTHKEPNYMGVFWWLLGLTIVEVAVIYMPIAKMAIYFMHLKFERRTLALVALSPFVLCVFLILMMTPDIFPR